MKSITKEFLESEIVDVTYTRLTGTLTHCAITVKSGFTFTGESACVDEANFNKELGEKYAYEQAFEKMWLPYGFWLKQSLDDVLPEGVEILPDGAEFDFGLAVSLLKDGKKVARKGWNGAGQFVYYVPANKYPADQNPNSPIKGHFDNDQVPYRAYLALKTAQNDVATWQPSISDVLAEDWVIVE